MNRDKDNGNETAGPKICQLHTERDDGRAEGPERNTDFAPDCRGGQGGVWEGAP